MLPQVPIHPLQHPALELVVPQMVSALDSRAIPGSRLALGVSTTK
jgi:hypothetical protein